MLRQLKKLLGDIHFALQAREHAYVNYLLPFEKRKYLVSFADQYETFIETGTYLGETTAAMADYYKTVHTVELMESLFNAASERFSDNPSIICHQGDSAEKILEICNQLDCPAVFWLDAHYSGSATARHGDYDSPIEKELSIIFKNNPREHLILIDDARLFVGRNSYPKIGHLRKFVRENSEYGLTVRDDIIRLWRDPEWS